MFLEDFFGGLGSHENSRGEVFGRIFLGEIFGRNFLGGILTLLKSATLFEYRTNWFVCQDFGSCQDFVSIKKEGGRILNP